MKPVDLIRLVLRDAGVNGVGQSPSDEENNDVLLHLNMMLGQWNRKRWMVYHLVDVSFVSTGALSYTVGTGGDFNIARPDRIEAAFARYVGTSSPQRPDLPVRILQAREDYNRIVTKGLTIAGVPNVVFYDAAYPVGALYWWPVPTSGQAELHISLKQELAQLTDLVTDINLPNEYLEAIVYNLAIRARIMFGLAPDPEINAMAKAAIATVFGANVQIPELVFGGNVPGISNRNSFNYITGGFA